MRKTSKSFKYSPIERLMQEVIATIHDPALDDEWMSLAEEPAPEDKKPVLVRPDIDIVAAELANAYKAGLQAGHIKGLAADEHDAADTEFWHAKAASLVNYIKSKATEQDIVVETMAIG
jgi:hypothetical protein